MSEPGHPLSLAEQFERFDEPPNSLQRAIFEAHRSVKVFGGEDFTELSLKDAMIGDIPSYTAQERDTTGTALSFRDDYQHRSDRATAVVCQEYYEKHIRKPGVLHKAPNGDVRLEAIQPASAKSVPLKSLSNAELTKLGLPIHRKTRR